MKVLSIDIGTYSIKVQEASIEKKRVYIHSTDEINIDQVKQQLSPGLSDDEVTVSILEELFEKKDHFDKITYQIPSQYIVTRFLTLPVKSKKKAQQILPFQLEDGLFSDLQSTHYITKFIPHKSHINAQAFLTRTDLFTTFFEQKKKLNLLPNFLVSEQTLVQDYIENEKLGQNFAILDIGHRTTKAYIVSNNEIISNHLIYFGGHNITELISETYQISYEEAEIYKKENAFFLTDKQYKEVDEDQQEFALFMKSAFQDLIKNFQIWDLGNQSLTGKQLNKVFIMGGTSKIKNITNFLSQSFNIKTEYLAPCKFLATPNSLDEQEEAHLQNVTMMSSLPLKKSAPLNFLHGNFAGNRDAQLPLYSIGFIGSRVLYISLIMLIALSIEHFVTKSSIKDEMKTASKKLKSPVLALKRKEKNLLKRRPERLLRILQNKEKSVIRAYNLVYSQDHYDVFTPLKKISNYIKNSSEFVITRYTSSEKNYSLTIKKFENGDLKKLHNLLKSNFGTDSKIKVSPTSLTISK